MPESVHITFEIIGMAVIGVILILFLIGAAGQVQESWIRRRENRETPAEGAGEEQP